jgi:hypothetical protein
MFETGVSSRLGPVGCNGKQPWSRHKQFGVLAKFRVTWGGRVSLGWTECLTLGER